MNSNAKAITVLLGLVLTSFIVFCAEINFLVAEPRGSALSNYKNLPYAGKIILLVEDFEGLDTTKIKLKDAGFFDYGSAKISVNGEIIDNTPLSLKTALKITWNGSEKFGGWGKGIGSNIDLDSVRDYLNFRVRVPKDSIGFETIRVILEEDDNDDGKLQKEKDDAWYCEVNVPGKDKWQMISVPLREFKDDNEGGDHRLNVTKKGGLHTIIFSFQHPEKYAPGRSWYFDFICFSNEKLPDDI